ncbi:unnamed protein product, partial [Aphanomyces euteiches]
KGAPPNTNKDPAPPNPPEVHPLPAASGQADDPSTSRTAIRDKYLKAHPPPQMSCPSDDEKVRMYGRINLFEAIWPVAYNLRSRCQGGYFFLPPQSFPF